MVKNVARERAEVEKERGGVERAQRKRAESWNLEDK